MNQNQNRIVLFHPIRLLRESLVFVLSQQNSISVIGSEASLPHGEGELEALNADLFILDFGGPSRTGLKDVLRIRNLSLAGKILLTEVPNCENDILACLECGASGYVLQDATVENLLANVRAVLAGETLCSPRIVNLACCRLSRLACRSSESGASNTMNLTKRETEIVALIEEGLSNKEIAVRLHVEISTVKNHVHNILDKLQLPNRHLAVQYLRERNLIKVYY